MGHGVKRWAAAILVIQVATLWPVWWWYAGRFTDSSDEPWGVVAAVTACILLTAARARDERGEGGLAVSSILMLAYATSWALAAPRLVQALIGVTALGSTMSILRFGTVFNLPISGLLLLSLPIVPSLQFYFGYPLRVIAGALAAPILQMGGLAVVREGTCLLWGDALVSIDAPCSGVRMLWGVFFVAFTVAGIAGIDSKSTVRLVVAATAVLIIANALRACSLFYLEQGLLPLPGWSHDATGVVLFLAATLAIARLGLHMSQKGAAACEA